MIRFFDMISDIGGFRAGLIHTLGLRLKAAHEATVGATGLEKGAAA